MSLSYAPFAAAAAVVLAAVLALGFNTGVQTSTLIVVILTGVTLGLAGLTFVLNGQLRRHSRQARYLRQITERMQAMLRAVPEAYCIFTPQGIMREAPRVAPVLGAPKIAHFEDLVAALKEPEDFVTAFRKLQTSGEGFSMPVATLKEGKTVQVNASRLRIGREAVLLDVLWFSDNPAALQAVEHRNTELTEITDKLEVVRTVYEALPFPVWLRGSDLNLTRVNAAYAKAVDVSPEEVISGQHELASATARSGSGRALAATALETGKPQSERRHVIVEGKRQLLELTEAPYEIRKEGEEAGTKGVFGFAVNVTAEEEKDTEIERHAASQREVLEHMGSAIAIYGPDTRLEFYNRSYVRLWHAEEAFLDSKPTFSEILEDARARSMMQEQADFPRYKRERIALFTSLLEPREDLMHLPDGTTLRILVSPHPMGGLIFVHEDVTDKLALESSYNTLIAVQRETLDNLAEGILVFGPDGKVGLFNPAAAHIWQVPAAYLADTPHISDLLEKTKELHSFEGDWNDFKKDAVAYTLDRNPRKGRMNLTNGVVLEYVAVPLPDGAVLNSYLDVTDSIKAERALRASNMALAAADRLKSEFVANVSYQLRTPLNTIMGFSEILTNQYFGALNERQMEYTCTIMDASKKLLLLINDVLDLATIEAGRMALDPESASIAGLLNAAKQMTAEWARQQSLEIVIDCPSDIGSFEVDVHRMKQVLFNLISNAVKYTPAGGRITMEARAEGEWIALTVIDTGIGIPASDLDRVFGKFERANAQARQSGAGLGLSLVKSFIELHGGRVEIASTPDQGTRVTCFIPVKAREAA
ncbi:MAG: PAS-domain containing protein [Alphaproteobacteria bacterium]|nr:PAS-domain containing protein [Alphaproteobacteria bacterium]